MSDNKISAILVVEDEPLIRMVATDMVVELGYEILEARDSIEAIQLLETRNDIRLLFTDIEMPGPMDGLRLANYVTQHWPPIKFLVVSGRMRPDIEALPAGSIFLSKPYQTVQVRNAVKRLLAA